MVTWCYLCGELILKLPPCSVCSSKRQYHFLKREIGDTCLVLGGECCGVENTGLEGGICFRVRIGHRWSEVDLVIGKAVSSRLKMTRSKFS